jgi:hypothetical protein
MTPSTAANAILTRQPLRWGVAGPACSSYRLFS